MDFTQEQKNQYLDNLATKTQEGIWMTEMALIKYREKLAQKKALLDIVQTKIDKKEYPSARDGKNEKAQVEKDIDKCEEDINDNQKLMNDFKEDLELIETV
jgi:hypothetical protein